jgi:hypothetical protein
MNDRPHVDLAEVIEKGSERAAIVECAVRARSSEYMLGCVGAVLELRWEVSVLPGGTVWSERC